MAGFSSQCCTTDICNNENNEVTELFGRNEKTLIALQTALDLMDKQNLKQDSRYIQLTTLRNEQLQKMGISSNKSFTNRQLVQFYAQIIAYKFLITNPKINELFDYSSEIKSPSSPASIDLFKKSQSGQTLKKITSSTTETIKPTVLQPVLIFQERENKIASRIALSIAALNNLPVNMKKNLRIRAEIKLKMLRLLNLQRHVRSEILYLNHRDTTLQTAVQLEAYKRTKIQDIGTMTIKVQNKVKADVKNVKEQQNFLRCILAHGKDIKRIHCNHKSQMFRLNKEIRNYGKKKQNNKKDTIEKERMCRLMNEDELGYQAQHIDQQKNKRLAFLFAHTDEYIDRLKDLVNKNKIQQTTSEIAKAKTNNENISLNNIDNENKCEQEMVDNTIDFISEEITEQPSIMVNGKLKDYQIKGLEWLVSLYNNNLNGILADEMGLGKTIQIIALVTYLIENKNVNSPFLVIVPLSTLLNWKIEFEKWAPSVTIVAYNGSQFNRRKIKLQIKTKPFNVLLTTYQLAIKDKNILGKFQWKYMIIDEGHRMKNNQSKLTQVLNTSYKASYRLLLTGTPLQNKLPELWALLNFLLPTMFQSCRTFEQWFNTPFITNSEQVKLNEEETILIIRRLHNVLRPFILRRLKKEVKLQLPDKVEYIIYCEMSGMQKVLYKHMQNQGVLLTDGSEHGKEAKSKGAKALMNTFMQLRKLCNHPFLFKSIEEKYFEHLGLKTNEVYSGPDLYRAAGKFELLNRILPKLKMTNHRILLFCQMTRLLSIMEDYLNWRGFKYLRLDGTTSAENRADLLNKFNHPDSDYFIFLLSTRAGGLGLNLQSADTVIIYDTDWNPHVDLQAQDRVHRIGQEKQVRVFRLITVQSIEEKIYASAKSKLDIEQKVIQAGMFDQKSTNTERQHFLESIINADNQSDEKENKISDDNTINQLMARSNEELQIFQQYDLMRQRDQFNQGLNLKSRLLAESELPDWLIKNENDLNSLTSNGDDVKFLVRSARQRKGVDYSGCLTEQEWQNFIAQTDDEFDFKAEESDNKIKDCRKRKLMDLNKTSISSKKFH